MNPTVPSITPLAPLTPAEVRQIAQALQRRAALAETTILTRENEAEAKGIEEFLRRVAYDHIGEFVATWHACVTEYEPFVMAWTRVMHRVASVDAQLTAQAQQQQQQQQQQTAEPGAAIITAAK